MKNPAVIGFYGESNTGKTNLIVNIIKQLTSENYKVATVKITDKNISIDTKGKDTWKHGQAGSQLVILSSPIETGFLLKKNINMDEIIQHVKELKEIDIVLVEGANEGSIPKIRIGNIPKRKNTILTYKGDFEGLINTIKNEINMKKTDAEEISLKVNGKQISLTEFPSKFIKNTIVGMLKSLKGIDEIKNVEINF